MVRVDPFCVNYKHQLTIEPTEVDFGKPPAVMFRNGVILVINWVGYRNFYLKQL
jgi:hypothetical protein